MSTPDTEPPVEAVRAFAPRVWTEWERPWTRATGYLKGYVQMTELPKPGQVVAIRSAARPYLPTFAPWWAGLTVEAVSHEAVSFVGEPNMIADFDTYPIATHWAVKP